MQIEMSNHTRAVWKFGGRNDPGSIALANWFNAREMVRTVASCDHDSGNGMSVMVICAPKAFRALLMEWAEPRDMILVKEFRAFNHFGRGPGAPMVDFHYPVGIGGEIAAFLGAYFSPVVDPLFGWPLKLTEEVGW